MKKAENRSTIKNLFKKLIENQMKAALCTLKQSINNCPEKEWNGRHRDYPFSQVVFHALFYTDYYLEKNEDTFKNQEFHLQNKDIFRDYEELEDRLASNLYERKQCEKYLNFCLRKCEIAVKDEDEQSLQGPSGFASRKITRAELYIYNIRHIQHHAAQLGLRAQQITGKELSWISSGWRDI